MTTWSMGKNITWYVATEVLAFFRAKPALLKTKRGHEIFAGAVCAIAFESERVGFPMKELKKSDRPTPGASLTEIIEGSVQVDDTDTDICIEYQDVPVKFQLVRLVPQSKPEKAHLELLRIIDKKLLVQTDTDLYLTLILQESLLLDLETLRQSLNNQRVPYGGIFILGKTTEKERGRFQLFEVWPGSQASRIVSTGLGL